MPAWYELSTSVPGSVLTARTAIVTLTLITTPKKASTQTSTMRPVNRVPVVAEGAACRVEFAAIMGYARYCSIPICRTVRFLWRRPGANFGNLRDASDSMIRIGDIFDLQDEITESIVASVEPEILSAEMRRARGKRADSLAAYDCVLRAYQHLFNLTLEDNDKALDFLRQAIRLAPDYALAYAYASWANLFRVQLTQGGSLRPLLTEALTLAQHAVELDPTDPLIQTIRGAWQLMIERDFDGGLARHEEAFQKNPNSVWICGCNGFGNAVCRNPQRTLDLLERARRLSLLLAAA